MRTKPRYWKKTISKITGLNFCDRSCPCGDNNELWWFSVKGCRPKPWVPGWMNGADTEEIWRWLVENNKT